jgi:hypothetical protein
MGRGGRAAPLFRVIDSEKTHGREARPKPNCFLDCLPANTVQPIEGNQTTVCINFRLAKKENQPKARGASQLPNKQTLDAETHKVLIYIEHHSLCPLVGIGTPQTSPASECALPPPRTKGWGGTVACG